MAEFTDLEKKRLARGVCAIKRRETTTAWTCPAFVFGEDLNDGEICPECKDDADKIITFINAEANHG